MSSNFFDNYGRAEEEKKDEEDKLEEVDNFFNDYPEPPSLPPRNPVELPQQVVSPNVVKKEEHSASSAESLESLFTTLDNLIGLNTVKHEVRRLVHFARVQNLRKQKGISSNDISLHSVFYGGPGTGKTTIARIYSKLLHTLGLLSKGHLVETDRSGLVGNYVGQTANKTSEKVEEAIGGVLFIDEAYSLHKGEGANWDYGSEAVEVLMKRMEDYRHDFVVVVAGYPKPMRQFLRSNEGFRSRFASYVEFSDYSPAELLEIFIFFCEKGNYIVCDHTLELVRAAIGYAYDSRDESFGNARFVRNLFDSAVRNHAMRVGESIADPSTIDLTTLQPEDVHPLIGQNLDF